MTVSVETEAFKPLLKLMEKSTGAVLVEWDPDYSAEDALVYTEALEGFTKRECIPWTEEPASTLSKSNCPVDR